MAKATIEADRKGWKTTIEKNGEIYTEEHIFTSTGARGKSDFSDSLPDELYEVFCEGFTQYEIAKSLIS